MPNPPGPFGFLLQRGEAALFLLGTGAALTVFPFRRVAAFLGDVSAESPQEISPGEVETAREVRRLVSGVSSKFPWKPTCLVRALSAHLMLRRRGVEGTLYLGVSREDDGRLRAHAWLRCGSVFVIGGKEREDYAEVARFSRVG